MTKFFCTLSSFLLWALLWNFGNCRDCVEVCFYYNVVALFITPNPEVWWEIRSACNLCLRILVCPQILIYTWELMKSVTGHSNSSLLFLMNVLLWHCVRLSQGYGYSYCYATLKLLWWRFLCNHIDMHRLANLFTTIEQ